MRRKGKTARFKLQRRLLTELPGLGKAGAMERKPYAPANAGLAGKIRTGQKGNRCSERRAGAEHAVLKIKDQSFVVDYSTLMDMLMNLAAVAAEMEKTQTERFQTGTGFIQYN